MATVLLSTDAAPLVRAIDSLLAELSDAAPELVDAVVSRLHSLGQSVGTVRLDPGLGAAGRAPQHRLVFEPSQAFSDLVAEVRAGAVADVRGEGGAR